MPDLDAATLAAVCFGLAVALCFLALTCAGLWRRNKLLKDHLATAGDQFEQSCRNFDRLSDAMGRLQTAASVNAFLADSARHFAEQVRAAEQPKPEAE